VLGGFGVGLVLRTRPRRSILVAYLAVLLIAFVIVQQYAALSLLLPQRLLAHSVSVVGLSYMLFRQIHFAVDAMQGQIQRCSLWTYLNYQLNCFALVAGPIQRYQDFHDYWQNPQQRLKEPHELRRTHLRILVGVIKIAGLAAACEFAANRLAERLLAVEGGTYDPGAVSTLLIFMARFYLYPAYVYLNFSGYCDVVIGGAALLGQELPENFDRPYLARNMIDFWNRWHRTLSFWIRDYVFTPMYKAIAERAPQRASSLAFLCYFVGLFLAGVWHGATWNFVIFGLLHAVAVSAAKVWENHIIKRRGRPGLKRYLSSGRIRAVAIAANLHFTCFTLAFFPADLERTWRIFHSVFRSLE
jgi:D-alanyl-lipoteichoic acid acyltransferase DltB (MBOAT superfamily)